LRGGWRGGAVISRTQRYALALHACRKLWARGLVAGRGPGVEADTPVLRGAMQAAVLSPAPLLPHQLRRVEQHLAALRAVLRFPIVECVNTIRVRQTPSCVNNKQKVW
jgi:hypothetical protein